MRKNTSKFIVALVGLAMLVGCRPTPSTSEQSQQSEAPSSVVVVSSEQPSEEPSVIPSEEPSIIPSEEPSVVVSEEPVSEEPVSEEPVSEEPASSEEPVSSEIPSSSEEPVEPGEPIRLGGAALALDHPGELVLEVGEKVDVVYARTVEEVSRIQFTVEEGAAYDALAVYLKNPGDGERYTLTFKVDPSVAFTGLVNGEPVNFIRGENEVTVHYDEPADGPSLVFHFNIDEEGIALKANNVRFSEFVFVERHYDSVDDIVIDGDMSDWENTRAFENTVGIKGITPTTNHKSADFYGSLREDGLLLMANVYHDLYVDDGPLWWQSTNFEFFLAGANQRWVSARQEAGTFTKSSGITEAAWVTEPLEGEGANFHTIVEVFIANALLPAGSRIGDQIRVGFAWKTDGDVNTGGEAAGGGEDAYWVPPGTWVNNADQTYVTINGVFREQQVELVFPPQELTVDGDMSDWADLDAYKTNFVYLEGSDATSHKNVTFYAYLATDGLYVAAVAHHDVFIDNNGTWHMNTNLEFFLNGGNQFFFAANGDLGVPFGVGEMVSKDYDGVANYETVAEIFYPREVLGNADMVRIGFAWKTNGDTATGLGGSGGNADAWWFEAGHWPNNADEQYYVTADGIFRADPSA